MFFCNNKPANSKLFIENLSILWDAPNGPNNFPGADKLEDRLLLFSLVFGTKPENCLEIGTYMGGSALIISAALKANGFGKVVSIDPNPLIDPQGQFLLVKGYSPFAIPEARKLVDNNFDFVFIDGNHSEVYADINGIIPFIKPNCLILLHDCFLNSVKSAIDKFLKNQPNFIDCGILGAKHLASGNLGCRLLRNKS